MPSGLKKRFLLLYGSQTGQAKAIAEEIQEKSDSYELVADLHCLSETEKKFNLKREHCVVFVLSTTGDGEPPDTVQKFWRRIHKRTLSDSHLEHLNYSLLGLGDSNYTNFCNCSKSLDKRLEQLGAKRFFPCAWADDGVGLEVAAEPWIDSVIPAIRSFLGLPPLEKDPGVMMVQKSENSSSSVNSSMSDNLSDVTTSSGSILAENTDNGSSSHSPVSNDDNLSVCHEDRERKDSLLFSTRLSDSSLTLPLLPHPYLQITFNKQNLLRIDDIRYQNGSPLPSASTPVTMATVLSARYLTADDALKRTLEVTLKVDPSIIDYQPGDAVSVICPNSPSELEALFHRLGIRDVVHDPYTLSITAGTLKKRASLPNYIPPQSTLFHVFSTCLDIRHPPKKALLRTFVEFTSNKGERRRLQELSSKQGAGEYSQFIHDARLSLLDVLNAFPSCCPSIESLLEHLPRLQPRPYSVASSPLCYRDQIKIVFNIVMLEKTAYCSERRGLCTGWMNDLTQPYSSHSKLEENMSKLQLTDQPVITFPLFGRTNQHFHMPSDLSIPLILIGPGTGVAPFLGFLQHREKLVADNKFESVGETWLFFGCRHEKKDFLFRDELERLKEIGILSHLCVSFSRDLNKGDNSRYVQHYIEKQASELLDIIENRNASIFVCGDAKNMAKNVNETFVQMFQTHRGLSEKDSKAFVMSLRLSKRYLEDVWT